MRIRWILAALGGSALAAVAAWLIVAFVGLAMTPVVSPLRAEPGEGEVVDEEFGVATVYEVTAEGLLSPAPSDEQTAALWAVYVRILTPEFAASAVSEFRVSDARRADTMAYVLLDDDGRWLLGANLAWGRNDEILAATLIHEYGHILAFSDDQLELAAFHDAFWTPCGVEAPAMENQDPETASAFYHQHEEEFVSTYAATNSSEDFAETFMSFVLEPRPDADSAIARKIGFFWDLPEFVAERERLRSELDLDETASEAVRP